MAKAAMETAAERYRRIRAEKAATEELHDVACECGMTWKCRKVGVEFWVTSGILPMHFVEKMVLASKKGGAAKPEEMVKAMAQDEVIQSIIFSSKVVRHTAVEPAIKETATEPTDIAQDEVMTCCYQRLLNWQMKGGEQSAGLNTFPQER